MSTSVQRTGDSANRASARTRTEPTSVTVRSVTQSRKENVAALVRRANNYTRNSNSNNNNNNYFKKNNNNK